MLNVPVSEPVPNVGDAVLTPPLGALSHSFFVLSINGVPLYPGALVSTLMLNKAPVLTAVAVVLDTPVKSPLAVEVTLVKFMQNVSM